MMSARNGSENLRIFESTGKSVERIEFHFESVHLIAALHFLARINDIASQRRIRFYRGKQDGFFDKLAASFALEPMFFLFSSIEFGTGNDAHAVAAFHFLNLIDADGVRSDCKMTGFGIHFNPLFQMLESKNIRRFGGAAGKGHRAEQRK